MTMAQDEAVRIQRVKKLRELIEGLDRCRVGRCEAVAKMDRILDELGIEIPHGWEVIKKDIENIVALPRKSSMYPRLMRLEAFSTILSRINYAVIGLAIASYFTGQYQMILGLLIASILIVNIVYFIKAYVKMKIGQIYVNSIGELEGLGTRIRDVVNYLIRLLRRELRALGYSLEAYRLKLWVPDYTGIKILKKPSAFSSSYIVALAPTSRREKS